jgi:L-lactate dehydrogenase complex protein LldE
MRVQLFGTCLVDTFFPETGEAAVRVLRHFGVEVVYPAGQTCCGKPADSAGYTNEVRKAAEHFLSIFDGTDPIVVPSGSCASMIRNHYPALCKDMPKLASRAERVAANTYELSEFLVQRLNAHEAGLKATGRLTYHASCQLTRELGVRTEPLLILQSLAGAEFVPMSRADRCCGFGGVFMARLPEISMAMADEKVETILATGADTVVGCDHGCLMNIADGLKRRGSPVMVKHIAQLLAEAL